MKILVTVKRVVDYNVKVGIKSDGTDVDIAGLKMGANPFDEHAIEEALRLKAKGVATEVVAVSIGTLANQDVLRHALAMGVDRVILVESEPNLQPLALAKTLKLVVLRERPQLIFLGKQAIDDDTSHTGQMLAAMLDYPQGCFVSSLDVNGNEVVVTREIEGGQETLALKLPAVVTADQRLNEPRFVKLPNLMLARKKTIEMLPLAELAIAFDFKTTSRHQWLKVEEPQKRKAGIKVGSVRELLEKLNTHEGIQI
jgi:electron transfer flavoprotein beta subunit